MRNPQSYIGRDGICRCEGGSRDGPGVGVGGGEGKILFQKGTKGRVKYSFGRKSFGGGDDCGEKNGPEGG